jgi:hypothetical protein
MSSPLLTIAKIPYVIVKFDVFAVFILILLLGFNQKLMELPMTTNFKPQVKVNSVWACNALVFATEQEAIDNARDLMRRWVLVENYRAVPSTDPVNYRWTATGLVEASETAAVQS